MTPERWQQVKPIFAAASALPSAERQAYLDGACAGDLELRAEIDSLLAAHDVEQAIVDRVAASDVLRDLALGHERWLGSRIGAYEIKALIGHGGMGTAFLAARADEVYDKRVAVKLIKRGMDSEAILRRFRHERQILANLQHPNIVMLLDGGSTDDGQPYFVMEYVEGVPIDVFCEEQQLSIPERLRLFLAVCAAVHHAHEQRVVHRDLKPSNILVTPNRVPKLLDFGIAKLLDAEDNLQTRETTLLARAMTPQYASPEQIRGEPLTPASDVYSLGLLLYELIAGRAPYRLEGCSPRDIERIVCEEPPEAPSSTAGGDANRSRTERLWLWRRLGTDLDTIVLTALAKEPSERYASARLLAQDIQRYLDGAPIVARPRRIGSRLARLRPRLRHGLAAAALLIIAAAGIAMGARLLFQREVASVETASIAVLPFVNVGGDPQAEYLSVGLTEDLINRLARMPRLKVIARDSAYRYLDKGIDPRQVGRELGVQTVLIGRVVQHGSSLSITAELVDTRDRRQIWGERYARDTDDIQALQSELTQRIAVSLRLQLAGAGQAAAAGIYTQDARAYEAYIRGRYFWNKRTPAAFKTAIGYFRQAVDLDPDFALAYVGLADSYGLLTEYHEIPAAETYGEAKRAVLKALQIDPDLPEALISLAYISQFYEWNFEAAERSYRRALELNPNYATGHQWYAEYLAAMGRPAEAAAQIKKALAVDPLSLIINAVESFILYMAGEYDQALTEAHEVLAMDPNFPEAYEYLKRSYDQKGQYREAIAARQTRRRILALDTRETPALAAAVAATDPRQYWRMRLEQELEESQTEGFLPYEFVEIYAQAGDTARALEWLERACAQHDFMLLYLQVAPNLEPLRAEPKFREIVARGCQVNKPVA